MSEEQGFYKLSWLTRIGFGVGDLSQNLIYQVIAGYAQFYYSDVYKIGGDPTKSSGIATIILTAARIVDVIWDPFVGAFVDKRNPKFGKYRTYLLYGGLPLSLISILCFLPGMNGSIPYAAITYILLQMLYTVVNVPYGAINASLTRDTHEVTVLTSTRMICANIGGFFVWTLMPIVVGIFAHKPIPWPYVLFNFVGSIPGIFFMGLVPIVRKIIGKKNLFYLLGCIGIAGFAMIYFISRSTNVDPNGIWMIIANFIKSCGFGIVTGYMWAIVPEVISYAEYTTGRRIAGIVNALTGMFYKAGNALGGAIPGLVNQMCGYVAGQAAENTMSKDAGAWFKTVTLYGVIGLILLIFCFTQTKERIVMDEKETKNVKFTDLFVEFVRNGPLRVIALYFITAFTAMCCSNNANSFLYGMYDETNPQTSMAREGIRWSASIIPIILNVVMMIIISFYSLSDEKLDEINRENEKRLQKADSA